MVESEGRYRQLVELAQEGIWALDNKVNTLFVNPRMAQMLGYLPSEMIGRSIFEYLDPKNVDQAKQSIFQLRQQGVKGHFEYAFPRKDGTHVDTSISLSTITDDQGQPTGILALVVDLTKRKQAEKALQESEERFRAISTSAMDAIILINRQDEIIYWNPAAEATFGFTEKDAVGRKLSELVVPFAVRQKYLALLSELDGEPFAKEHLELPALRKDETEFTIDLAVSSIKLKDQNCLLAVVKDVSERKAMKEALLQERDMLENMAANIGAGLAIISPDYQVLYANQLLKKISGNKNLEKTFCYSMYGSQDGICKDCGVRKVLETGALVDRHDCYIKKEGYEIWVELIVTPVKDKDGKVVAALELAVDVTERKRLQEKLAEYSQKLEELINQRTKQLEKTQAELVKSERLAAIGELAGMVGHDLRNPLTGIKNSTYYLKKKGAEISESQAEEMLEIIEKCVDYSNKIVNDLLDYSREMNLDTQECSPMVLLTESLKLISMPEKIEVVNLLTEQPHLNVDSDKIRRVFTNLLKNAIDSMSNVGKITVDSKEVNGMLEISFTDTGTGIAENVLPKLFFPLFTTKAQGMGFGLAICKRIIEAHGGVITVKTAIGKGTTFTVSLPIVPRTEIGGEKVWIKMPESLSSMTMKA